MYAIPFSALTRASIGAAILGFASLTHAAEAKLFLTPTSAGTPPSTLSVDISAVNLTAGSAIGAYDLQLTYDAAVWTPTGAVFSSFLGDLDNMEAITSFDFSTVGVVRLVGVSLVGPFDPLPLSDIQPAAGTAFSLAKVSFDAVGTGLGRFGLRDAQLSDAMGASVSVVPEPGTWALMALGLGAIGAIRSRAGRKPADATA